MIITSKDILGIPYKSRGRGVDGMDCYGYAIFIERLMGHRLRDVLDDSVVKRGDINVEEVEKAERGTVVEFCYKKHLHVGVCLNKVNVIHMTEQGVRVNALSHCRVAHFYKVID